MAKIIVYGAYGYTGRLITAALKAICEDICLSGRSPDKLEKFAIEMNLPFQAADLNDSAELDKLLNTADLVIHCAGPFIYTAIPMVESCLRTGTHYLDITGEYKVFEAIQRYNEKARSQNLMLMPGAGFDVVPTDCLSNYLASKVEDPQSLVLAFTSKGAPMSRGTSKTMIEGLQDGHISRVNGKLEGNGLGADVREIDYGGFTRYSMGISWGDISTAFFSTGIPNIKVYTAAKKKQVNFSRNLWRFRFLLKTSAVKNWLKRRVDRNPAGPSPSQLDEGASFLYGVISNKNGDSHTARLTTFNGYKLTYMCAVDIANRVISGDFSPGYQTPASAYGWQLLEEVTGHRFTDN